MVYIVIPVEASGSSGITEADGLDGVVLYVPAGSTASSECPIHARMRGFIPGSEAQMIAKLISACDQRAVGALSPTRGELLEKTNLCDEDQLTAQIF